VWYLIFINQNLFQNVSFMNIFTLFIPIFTSLDSIRLFYIKNRLKKRWYQIIKLKNQIIRLVQSIAYSNLSGKLNPNLLTRGLLLHTIRQFVFSSNNTSSDLWTRRPKCKFRLHKYGLKSFSGWTVCMIMWGNFAPIIFHWVHLWT